MKSEIIKETQELSKGYKLISTSDYRKGTLCSKELDLYDASGNYIAGEIQDENGLIDYKQTSKKYWTQDLNKPYELFESRFDEQGALIAIRWFDHPSDQHGQTGFFLHDTPEDRARLGNLTGMSKEMVEYYFMADVYPTFLDS